MLTKVLAATFATASLALAAVGFAPAKGTDCCSQKLACCDSGKACCQAKSLPKCCAEGKACCAEDSACCDAAPKCCLLGEKCCDTVEGCCDTSPAANAGTVAHDTAAHGSCCKGSAKADLDF